MEEAKTFGITFKDKVGYALGDTAGLFLFSLVGTFLQMFYTDVMYIDTGKIMVLFVIARVWDAINDPIWGAFVDTRKQHKHGKFLPYMRWGSIPMAVFGALMFLKIPGLSEHQYLIYAYVTYIGYGMMYTVVNIPYGSLACVVTTDEQERSALSMYRSVGAGIGGLPGQILLPLFVYSTVITETGEKLRVLNGNSLFWGVLLLAGFCVIVYQFSCKMTKERVIAPNTQKKVNVGKTVRALLRNRPFIMLCIASMMLIAVQHYTQSLYNYLFKNYFAKPALYSLVTVFTYLPMAMLLPFLQKIVRKYGKKEVCALGMVLAAVSNLVLWLIHTHSIPVFFLFCFLSGLGMTFFVLEIWALVMDVIDYQETLSGQRDEGTSYAFFSFTRKLGQTLAGVLSTGVLGMIGYDAKNITPSAVSKMYSVATLLPFLMCLVMAVTLGFFYPLTKTKLAELHGKNDSAEASI